VVELPQSTAGIKRQILSTTLTLNYLRDQMEPRMRRLNFNAHAEDDSLPVMVTRNDKGDGAYITRARETAAQALGRGLARIAYDEKSQA
jgi:hypothetical protein